MTPRWTILGFGLGALAGWVWYRRAGAVRDIEERERMWGILDALPVGLIVIDPDGRMLHANPAAGDIWDGPPMLTGPEQYDAYKAFRPETGERVRSSEWGAARVVATGAPAAREELEIETFGGHRKTILNWALPIHGGRGQLLEVVAVNVDVTERKHAEEERERLLRSEREARGQAERRAREEAALREAIGAVSRSFTAEAIVGQIAERAIEAVEADGAYVTRIHLDGTVEAVAEAGQVTPTIGHRWPYAGSYTARVVEDGQPLSCALDDRPAPVELADVPARSHVIVIPLIDAGEPIGALFIVRRSERGAFRRDEIRRAYTFGDLAALAFRRVHLLEDSERRREELERVTESRARLVRGFSHDLRNPLGAADGYAQLVEGEMVGPLNDKQKQSMGRLRRSLQRAVALIDDLLELARAEAGQVRLERVPTDVRDAVRELGDEYRAQAEQAGLALELDIPQHFPVIESDANRVRQILGNLLSNAVKYTDAGRILVRMRSRSERAERCGDWIAVEVSDTGRGIAPEQQARLFQEFSRVDPGVKRGAGLGLAISQRIARALGGEITVESERGVGSTFTLWLPCADLNARSA